MQSAWIGRLLLVLGVVGSASAGGQQPCQSSIPESSPTASFVDAGNGTTTDLKTGLMWKRCAEGQSWDGAGYCNGTATSFTWQAALRQGATANFAGHADWRLPSIKELRSIVEQRCYSPAINSVVFPNTSASDFWSASANAGRSGYAWLVGFGYGSTYDGDKYDDIQVRLVRIGQSPGSLSAVVEYLDTTDFPNSPGGHFFYSSDPAERAAIDAGAAGAFSRTGRQFLTGGTSPVCRFYGSLTPGPNSHFFTVDVNECNVLKAAQITPKPATVQQWNYEGSSYSTTPVSVAANGSRSCPANTLPLYRAYNNAYPVSGPKNPWDSNHRFTPAQADIASMVGTGWRDEGIVFCTAQ